MNDKVLLILMVALLVLMSVLVVFGNTLPPVPEPELNPCTVCYGWGKEVLWPKVFAEQPNDDNDDQ